MRVQQVYSSLATEPQAKHPFPVGWSLAQNVGYPDNLRSYAVGSADAPVSSRQDAGVPRSNGVTPKSFIWCSAHKSTGVSDAAEALENFIFT